jgi:NADH:ubiquinone oxidoreductase subunit E
MVAVEEILEARDYDARDTLALLEQIQRAYGYLPVAVIKHVSHVTGAPYALVYGTATYYRHLRFDKPGRTVAVCRCTSCLMAGAGRIEKDLATALDTEIGRSTARKVALEQLPSHVPGESSPLVTLNGKPQPDVTAAGAAAWGRSLAGKTVA